MCDMLEDIYNYINTTWDNAKKDREDFFNKLHTTEFICLFGAGGMGIDIAYYLRKIGVNVNFFCDNNEKLNGKEICLGIKCISITELLLLKENVFIIISTGYYNAIFQQLLSMGFENVITMPTRYVLECKTYLDSVNIDFIKSNIHSLYNILEDDQSRSVAAAIIKRWLMPAGNYHNYNYHVLNSSVQYFPKDIIELTNKEVFVDVGAYIGDTISEFLTITHNSFNKIIAYELDKKCFDKLEDYIQSINEETRSHIKLFNLGIYDSEQIIRYSSNAATSAIDQIAGETGSVVSLSDHCKEEITFVKMDIEGSEVRALYGAEKIIKKYKPKLAICVYHQPNHLWDIPIYIKQIVPEYKIYIRHHSDFNVETVCYAVL